MTGSAPPEPELRPDDAAALPRIPDWKPLLAAGELRRALAAARLTEGVSPGVRAALEDLELMQEALRARNYPGARRRLGRYAEELESGELDSESRAALRRAAHESELTAGLDALEASYQARHTDAAALEAALAPALAGALTRAEAHNSLGVLHALQEDRDAARQRFDLALESDPRHYRALTNRGSLELEEGQLDAAELSLRASLAIEDSFAGTHHNLGVLLRRRGQRHESVRHIRRAQRLQARQIRSEQDEQIRSTPQGRRLVATVRVVMLVLLVVVALWLVLGRSG